ncbi:aldo/keto reductase [Luteipulveratus halotolerans]|uniref:Aldo/keto reductase n=1 Tax=Luteipulveratus halotolerans TaxID=1631356 RepID=A0A0L6CGX2_9MICO|nr:aldo/keto reductase [Luteipulveratus halotolerans]KNX37052.1 aldo/keto reductase [Luteipulveratus halotolerans]
MRSLPLGRSGLRVSALTLGTLGWGTDVEPETAREQLEAYVAGGGHTLDTAHGYGLGETEQIIGDLTREVVDRDDLTIITKAGISRTTGDRVVDTSRGTLMRQLDLSLERMRTSYVDLWLVHTWSDEPALEETLSALEWAVSTGRARYVGVSNYQGWQMTRAHALLQQARVSLVANEIEYSLLRREAEQEVCPAAAHLGVGLLAWSPLARGALTGKYRHNVPADSRAAQRPSLLEPYLDDHSRAVVEAVSTAADGLGVTPAEVALGWLTARPSVAAAVIGARTVTQLRSALKAVDLVVPDQVTQALDEVSG